MKLITLIVFIAMLGCVVSVAVRAQDTPFCYPHAYWIQAGPSLPDSVISSVVLDDRLYVLRGQTETSSDLTISYWDGTSWHDTLNVHTPMWPTRLGVLDGQFCLYGGAYPVVEGAPASYEMRSWNGASWQPLSHPRIASFTGFTQFKGDIYAIGDFYINDVIYQLVRCRGGVWEGIARARKGSTQDPFRTINGKIHCLLATEDVLYVGGDFLTINGQNGSNVLQWDGESLQKVGNGIEGNIRSMDTLNGDLYACGGLLVNDRINVAARFDGTTWKSDSSFLMEQYWTLAHIKNYRGHVYIWNELGQSNRPGWRWDGRKVEEISELQGYVNNLLIYRDELIALGPLRETCGRLLRTFARLHLDGASSVTGEYSAHNGTRCYPNPAEDIITVEFPVHQRGRVSVKVSDIRGAHVTVLADEDMEEGLRTLRFSTDAMPNGQYVIAITQGSARETHMISIIH